MTFLNELKPKYEHLNSILADTVSNITFTNEVIVIVDVKQCLKKCFRRNSFVVPENERLFIEEATSGILNIIGHYRNYLYKNFNKTSTFYFLYSETECEYYKKMYPEYKEDHYEYYYSKASPIHKLKEKIIKTLKIILKASSNCAFVDTSNYEDFNYAEFLISQIPKNQLVLLLSDDIFYFKNLSDNVVALNGKGIESILLTEKNVLSEIISETDLTAGTIPLILSISGDKHYSLNGVKSLSLIKSKNIIEKLVKEKKLLNSRYNILPKTAFIGEGTSKTEEALRNNLDEMETIFSIANSNVFSIKEPSEFLENICLDTGVIPNDFFISINSKFFTNYPINLEMYFRGE